MKAFIGFAGLFYIAVLIVSGVKFLDSGSWLRRSDQKLLIFRPPQTRTVLCLMLVILCVVDTLILFPPQLGRIEVTMLVVVYLVLALTGVISFLFAALPWQLEIDLEHHRFRHTRWMPFKTHVHDGILDGMSIVYTTRKVILAFNVLVRHFNHWVICSVHFPRRDRRKKRLLSGQIK